MLHVEHTSALCSPDLARGGLEDVFGLTCLTDVWYGSVLRLDGLVSLGILWMLMETIVLVWMFGLVNIFRFVIGRIRLVWFGLVCLARYDLAW